MCNDYKEPDWLLNGPQPRRRLTWEEDEELAAAIALLDDARDSLYEAMRRLSDFGFSEDELDSAQRQIEEFSMQVDDYREEGYVW
jgi:hypothetical protein